MEKKCERVLLVGVHTGAKDVLKDSNEQTMAELTLLAQTADAEVVGQIIQNRHDIERATYIGEGKIEEVRIFCESNEIDTVIFDDELSGIQLRNLERDIGRKVIDRSMLILDIFAKHAQSAEGKIQVELAQLKYHLSRLVGSSEAMSRLGGGIGTRGPGETKLETDRRHIRRRIKYLSEQLDEVVRVRDTKRRARIKEGVQQVALVGYTNAGKSTLLNLLTDAGVLAEDKLFATLDPTARRLTLPDGTPIVLIDTVGFIRKLPHHLIKAFRSTMEEALLADVLVIVVDASSEEAMWHIQVVRELLNELGAGDKPRVIVNNKMDLVEEDISLPDHKDSVNICATTGEGVEGFLKALGEALPSKRRRVYLLIPFSEGSVVSKVYEHAQVEKEEFTQEGIYMQISVDSKGMAMIERTFHQHGIQPFVNEEDLRNAD